MAVIGFTLFIFFYIAEELNHGSAAV